MSSPTRERSVATPNDATVTRPERSSKRVAHKSPLGWLPWLLLGLLALLLALTFLVINAVDDDGPDGSAGDSLGQVGASDGSGANGQDGEGQSGGTSTGGQSGTAGSSGGGAPAAGAAGAALTAGSQDLLNLPGNRIGSLAGQAATGQAKVQSVVADEGFWVGESEAKRVFVFLTPQARQSAGESGYQVKAGETVSLEGSVKRSDAGFAERAGVEESEGSRQLVDQGGYIEATKVALAQ